VHSILGVWKLVEVRARDASGRPIESRFGPRPIGVVTFDGERMIAALGDGRREVPAGQPRAYNSYGGAYTFDGDRLVTRVDCAASPELLGSEQVRGVRFERDGARAVLAPPPRMVGGAPQHLELVWDRVG